MDDRTRIFIENLEHYINKSGKSQKEIAEKLDIPESTISTWMKGKAFPRMGKLQILADYFGCSIADLVEKRTNPAYANPDIIATITLNEDIYCVVEKFVKLDADDRKFIEAMIDKMS